MPDLTTMEQVRAANPPLGPRIRLAREGAGYSVQELALRVGVEAASVRAWESGKRAPRANRLQMLAGVLNVNLTWLLEGREDRHRGEEAVSVEALRQRMGRARQMIEQGLVLLDETQAAMAQIDAEERTADGK